MQNNAFSTNITWNARGRLLDLSTPRVMGILNVTPDSFFDGNKYREPGRALHQIERMLTEGADMIDIGGYSSRPGADDISAEEERARVVPVIAQAVREFPSALFSIDTFRSSVAKPALDAGVSIVNDITGGEHDTTLPALAVGYQAPYIAMHMRGTPKTMGQLTSYSHVVREVIDVLEKKVTNFRKMGLVDIALDPGFGFAKTVEQNFELLRHLEDFRLIGQPLLVGLSRKSMIWRPLGIQPSEALNGTTALNVVALQKGATILRVHDVKEARECVQLMEKLKMAP